MHSKRLFNVAAILNSEHWYGDGKPVWPNRAPSQTAAKNRLKVVKRLRRFAKDFPAAWLLADRLEECAPSQRCKCGPCPECSRALQRWFVQELNRLIVDKEPSSTLLAVSLVLPTARASQGRLHTINLSDTKDELTTALDRSRLADWAMLGVDVSFNDDTAKNLGTRYQVQLYGVASVRDRNGFGKVLRSLFQRSRLVARQSQIKLFDGSNKAISYGLKPESIRRVAYWGKRWSQSGEVKGCWKTRKVSLRAKEHVELLLWLDQIGLAQRIYLYRLRAASNRLEVKI